jgi:intracellular sulfur oxidation DsrE/DsrF family protein
MAAATTAEPAAPAATKLGCVAPAEFVATATVDVQGSTIVPANHAAAAVPKVVFQLNKAEDAPAILRFVTNYLAVEPTAQVAVVGYAGGIDFMLRDARDTSGKPYADQVAALAARGVAFKACNNTLKARNLTAEVVSPPATVVPGAVNEIIRLQTREGYAYFQN